MAETATYSTLPLEICKVTDRCVYAKATTSEPEILHLLHQGIVLLSLPWNISYPFIRKPALMYQCGWVIHHFVLSMLRTFPIGLHGCLPQLSKHFKWGELGFYALLFVLSSTAGILISISGIVKVNTTTPVRPSSGLLNQPACKI